MKHFFDLTPEQQAASIENNWKLNVPRRWWSSVAETIPSNANNEKLFTELLLEYAEITDDEAVIECFISEGILFDENLNATV